MMTLSQSVVVHAPRDVVFEYVTDPARLADWIPPMVEAREIVGSGAGQQYEWTYKLAGLLFRGQTVVVEYVPNELSVHQAIGAIVHRNTVNLGSDRLQRLKLLELQHHRVVCHYLCRVQK